MLELEFLKNYEIDTNGKIVSMYTNKVLKQHKMDCGYMRVKLWLNGSGRSFLVHRLVAAKYIENTLKLPEVNHLNGIKDDNRVENLEWVTRSQNLEHAYRTNLHSQSGENNSNSQLTEQDVISIYELLLDGCRNVDVSKRFNVDVCTVTDIKFKRNWKELLKDFPNIQPKPKKDKLSDSTVMWICERLQEGLPPSVILKDSKNSNINVDVILDIKRRKCYAHLSKDYNW